MKEIILASMFAIVRHISLTAQNNLNTIQPQYEIKLSTSVESIVPMGLGRSRLISTNVKRDYKAFSSEQTEDDTTRNKSERKAIRVKDFEETKLLNFYNISGIRFQNIPSNDAVIG